MERLSPKVLERLCYGEDGTGQPQDCESPHPLLVRMLLNEIIALRGELAATRISSGVEQCTDIAKVGGSIPSSGTTAKADGI